MINAPTLRASRFRPGFTLIELLVVVAIVCLLAALLMPALRGARQRAQTVTCINNLKQQGAALNLFAGDHNGAVPSPANYTLALGLGQYLGDKYGQKAIDDGGIWGGAPWSFVSSVPASGALNAGGMRIPRTDWIGAVPNYEQWGSGQWAGISVSAYFSATTRPCPQFICPSVKHPEGDWVNTIDFTYACNGWDRYITYGAATALFITNTIINPALVDLCQDMKPYMTNAPPYGYTVGCLIHNDYPYNTVGDTWARATYDAVTLGRRLLTGAPIIRWDGRVLGQQEVFFAGESPGRGIAWPSLRHMNKGNLLMLDGSVKSLSRAEMPWYESLLGSFQLVP